MKPRIEGDGIEPETIDFGHSHAIQPSKGLPRVKPIDKTVPQVDLGVM
jgi:hypothetical protein